MKKQLGLLLLLFGLQCLQAQTSLTLKECETQFLKNNLVLLAQHYNIDAAQALTIQAKIWDNPIVSADLNAYNPEAQKYFDNGKQGAKAFSISQIIYLGGKKANEVKLSKANEQIAEIEFNDLLRNLKLQLRKSFFTIYYNLKKIETTDKQLVHIEDLVTSYSAQVKKGNLPLKDLIRLQSLYLNFKNERLEVLSTNYEEQANLKLLLNKVERVIPVLENSEFEKYNKEMLFDVKNLKDIAVTTRPDYLLSKKNIEATELNIKLQKSLAIPDITLGVGYTQRGAAFDNQKNITLAIPLPLWNKNKGNIQYAKTLFEQSKTEQEKTTIELETEIIMNINKWADARKSYNQIGMSNPDEFEQVYQGVVSNFKKSNLSILEFTDFMESYNQSIIQLNELKKKVVLSAEELNCTINKDLF
ncbi:TolC family protein [Flavobacterium ovatum]|uniref:TolC family protein n=1 Tax=Flavobacterium ovatum TaxID=1928857 RepID=UPI00344EF757